MTTTLQQSHNALAHALAQFTDQLLRGQHRPTRVQWMEAASAMREAAALVGPEAILAVWLTGVATVIEDAMKE